MAGEMADLLAEESLLCGWSDADFGKLMAHVERRSFRTGDVVIHAGEIDRALYIVTDGKLEVILRTPVGPKSIAVVDPGMVVGEQCFLDGHARSADVQATADGQMLRLDGAAFERFADREPRLARALLFDLGRIVSVRLRLWEILGHGRGVAGGVRVAADALLPLLHIHIDDEIRERDVAAITESDFFRDLKARARAMRAGVQRSPNVIRPRPVGADSCRRSLGSPSPLGKGSA